jgi:hypothetical protein
LDSSTLEEIMARKGSEVLGTTQGDSIAEDAQTRGWNFEKLLGEIEEEYKSTGVHDFWHREREAIRSALRAWQLRSPKLVTPP